MNRRQRAVGLQLLATVAAASGCAAPRVDFGNIQRPARAAELDAFEVFVGSWSWEAELLNGDEKDKNWTGTAEWQWTLDRRCLHGTMAAKSSRTEFASEGLWSWHPKEHEYVWTMFNDWGYPQHGEAKYDAATKRWTMNYRNVGLDGTTSHGRYEIRVVDNSTLEWHMQEWADGLHLIQKMEMKGTYRRKG